MIRLTRDKTGAVSRDQTLRRERGQGNDNFPCLADHEQVDNRLIYTLLYKVCDDYTYIHTYIHTHIHTYITHNKCAVQQSIFDIEFEISSGTLSGGHTESTSYSSTLSNLCAIHNS